MRDVNVSRNAIIVYPHRKLKISGKTQNVMENIRKKHEFM